MSSRLVLYFKIIMLFLFISNACANKTDVSIPNDVINNSSTTKHANKDNSRIKNDTNANLSTTIDVTMNTSCSLVTNSEECFESECIWCNNHCNENDTKCSEISQSLFGFDWNPFSWFGQFAWYIKVFFWSLVGLVGLSILVSIRKLFCG